MASTPFARTPKSLELPAKTSPLVLIRPRNAASGAADIRSTFSSFLATYSQQVVLQRINLNIHCTHCWSEVSGEGDPLCIWCLGRGYESVFEIHRSRRMSSLNEHRQQLTVQSSPGTELVDEVFWFFDWDVNPQEEDMVYEVSWLDAAQTVVDKLLMPYQVTYSVPFRGVDARVEFWRASGLGRPIDRSIVGRNLQAALARELKQDLQQAIIGPAPTQSAPTSPPASITEEFVYTQMVPASVWTIVHRLGHPPNVIIVDSANEQVMGEVDFTDLNNVVTVTFSAPFAGKAYLN